MKDQIIEMIRKYNADTSVPPEVTLEGLEIIASEAEMMADAIRETIEE
jgi:hypothetical protein